MSLQIEAKSISKSYSSRSIFRDCSINLTASQSLCIKGPNGSGKSTLMKILAKLIKPTSGSVVYSKGGSELDDESILTIIGFLSPHVEPYAELTPKENIRFALKTEKNYDRIEEHLINFGLGKYMNVPVHDLSTGLKQRLKYVLAIINDPVILFFDEPGSNLDSAGREQIYSHIKRNQRDKIVIVATNVIEEERLCNEVIALA